MSRNNIKNIHNAELEEWSVGKKYAGLSGLDSKELGAENMGFHVEILPPGKYTCPYHYHHAEEELFIVIEGKATLRQNDEFKTVGKGDLIFFKTGPEFAHQFYNHTETDFKFFVLSSKNPFDICEYPDSDKILVRKAKKLFIRQTEVPYIAGEDNPERFWPEINKSK